MGAVKRADEHRTELEKAQIEATRFNAAIEALELIDAPTDVDGASASVVVPEVVSDTASKKKDDTAPPLYLSWTGSSLRQGEGRARED